MILEILKLNGSVLTHTFLFQTLKSSVFETCTKPYYNLNEQGTNSTEHVTTSSRCDVGTSRRRHVATLERRDVVTLRRWNVATSSRCVVGTSRRGEGSKPTAAFMP